MNAQEERYELFEGARVIHTEATSRKVRRRGNPERGFSIIELLIVCLIIFTVSAMAIIQLQPTWQQLQANAGMSQLKSAIRAARETAISQRRTIVVKFVAPVAATPCAPSARIFNCVELFQMVVSGTPPAAVQAPNPFLTLPFSNNVALLSFAGEPDTPDSFIGVAPTVPTGLYTGGNAGAPVSGLQFQSDGTFTDGNGTAVNVTILLGIAKIPTSARAMTILGNTGRVSAYHGTGVYWFK
jgi:type II secretory pathway pseudopilin PulG